MKYVLLIISLLLLLPSVVGTEYYEEYGGSYGASQSTADMAGGIVKFNRNLTLVNVTWWMGSGTSCNRLRVIRISDEATLFTGTMTETNKYANVSINISVNSTESYRIVADRSGAACNQTLQSSAWSFPYNKVNSNLTTGVYSTSPYSSWTNYAGGAFGLKGILVSDSSTPSSYPVITAYADSIGFAGSSVIFGLNVTTNTSTNVYADLIFNGTNLGYSTRTIIDGNTTALTKTYTIPNHFGNLTGINYTWYWNISTINNRSAYTNITIRTYDMRIDNCTNATQMIYNFTLYNENTRALLSAANITTTMEASLYSSIDGSLISISNTTGNKTNFMLCTYSGWLATNKTAYLYLSVSYDADGFYRETYNVHNFLIGNTTIPQHIKLLMLDETTSNKIYRVNLKDASLINIENAIIEIYRYYPGTSEALLTEAPTTDTIGNAIAHLTLSDADYKIVLKQDGSILDTKNRIRVYETTSCNSLYADCYLNLQLQAGGVSFGTFDAYKGITYNYSYDKTNRQFSLIFSSLDGEAKFVSMNVTRYYTSGTQQCYSSTTSISDTITCSLPTTFNGTVINTVLVGNELLFTDIRKVTPSTSLGDIDELRWFIIALLLPMLVVMGYASIGVSILMVIAGVVLLIGTGFLNSSGFTGGGSVAIWLILCLVFIGLKAYLGGQKNG